MNLNVLVVDDEAHARTRLCDLLALEPGVRVLGECATVREAVCAIREHAPDVVFLDIQLRAESGFEVISEVGSERMPGVIFVTAYKQHAIRAFDVHAVDYLLKPYDRARFRQALARAQKAQQSRGRYAARIIVRTGGRAMHIVETASIDWIEAAGNYVILHIGGQRVIHRESLQALEQRLDPRGFARVHRSSLVNIARIDSVTPWSGGDYHINLKSGQRVRLSRTFREAFEQRIEQHAV